MQDYYAARAKEYDQIYAKPERQADLRQMEAWLPSALAGRNVLEIACGTGYWTQFYAPQAQAVLAMDGAPQTLEIARTRVPANVTLAQGDAYQLAALEQRPWDAAFAGFWWSHIPRTRISAFLQGLHSVLQPGAKVVFMDNRYVPGSSTPISEPDADGDTYQQRPLRDGSTHRVLKNFPSREELLACVADDSANAQVTEWDYFWALIHLAAPLNGL
ncbi:class I SAM-dependent methyltransferase [Acidovorax sp. DW039]|uniref:class I SAM-dependent methyltransferase n=1 Tax=Acidovorax sp. DW039 TaxID=3095606 RepID=UPI003086C84B|nr:class I SAM-dependent methyltransferase [Acidovorax sp. DW039]